jgi:hypothetical protein
MSEREAVRSSDDERWQTKDEAKLLHSSFKAVMKQWNNNGNNYKKPAAFLREQQCDKRTFIRNLVAAA